MIAWDIKMMRFLKKLQLWNMKLRDIKSQFCDIHSWLWDKVSYERIAHNSEINKVAVGWYSGAVVREKGTIE